MLRAVLLLSVLALSCLTVGTVCASEAGVLFQQGVEHAERGEWNQAAASFEEALALEDKPSLRFNLVLAFDALGRPLEVAKHAIAFLSLPTEPHRAEARAKVERALADAQQKLARLDASALPADADLSVDGKAPVRDARFVYLMPERHQLSLITANGTAEHAEVTLQAGSLQFWPRVTTWAPPPTLPPVALPAPGPSSLLEPTSERPTEPTFENTHLLLQAQESRMRKRLAWTLGVIGAVGLGMGVATYAAAQHAAKGMRSNDPFTQGPVFLSNYEDYVRWTQWTSPFAATGSALTSAAIAVGDHSVKQRSSFWAWSALGGGTALMVGGIALVAREPDQIDNSRIDEPTRYAGALLLSAALPLLTYAVTYALRHRGEDRVPPRIAKTDLRWQR